MKRRWIIPLLHILVWALVLTSKIWNDIPIHNEYVANAQRLSGLSPFWFVLVSSTCYQTIFIVAFYTAYAWIGPFLIPHLRYGRASIGLLLTLTATVTTRYLVEYHLLKPLLHFDNYFGHTPPITWYCYNCILVSDQYMILGLLLSIWMHTVRINQERVQAELAFLKSQLNPHFLFNTINDIYALTYQKSDEAPEALLKLSGILRYTLYEGTPDKAPLQKELDYLRDYLDLQRLGAKQQLYLDYSVEGDVAGVQIAPLLLIPFAENMVKHGVLDDPASPAHLRLCIENGHFKLDAVNAVRQQQKDQMGGIGLQNVQRRLELLYPRRHVFTVTEDKGLFHCSVNIQLNK